MKHAVLLMLMLAGLAGLMADGNALFFDGSNDVVELANPGPTNIITAECWFQPLTLGTGDLGRTILSSNPSSNKSMWLTSVGTELRLWMFGSSNNSLSFTTSGANIQVGNWYHVAITGQRGAANRTILYLNGVEMINQPSYDFSNFGISFYFGNLRSGANSTYAFHGYIDEVRVWTTIRSQSDILNNMNTIVPLDSPGLVGYWPLDSSNGATVYDMVEPAANGTVQNGTTPNPNPAFAPSDVTLPVELTSFMATGTSDFFIRLTWITHSEAGVAGYYVYRNDVLDFGSAYLISDLIEAQNQTSTTQYSYIDDEVSPGTWYYWLQHLDYNGDDVVYGPVTYTLSEPGEGSDTPGLDAITDFLPVYPNPFNPSVFFPYLLETRMPVKLQVVNLRGQVVKSYDLGDQESGLHTVAWDGTDTNGRKLSTGIYLVRLQAGDKLFQRKAVMVK